MAQMNRPAISDLAAEDITNLMIWEKVRTGPLPVGTGVSSKNHDVRISAALSLADIEVCGIRVTCKDHATGAEEDAIVGVSGDVIQELE